MLLGENWYIRNSLYLVVMTEEYDLFYYRAKVTNVVDGDTVDLVIDQGFRTFKEARVRLLGVDTAETHFVSHDSDEYRLGVEQTEFVEDWLQKGRDNYDGEWSFLLNSHKDGKGKYGRYLGHVIRRSDGAEITASLLNKYGESVRY